MVIENQPEKQKGPNTAENHAQKQGSESTPAVPPAGTPPQPPVAADCQQDPYKKKNHNLARKQFWVSTVTLVVLGIYTWIAGCQANLMRRTVSVAIDTAQRQFMAYALYSNDNGQISLSRDGKSYEAVVDIKNAGQTPAYNVETWADSMVHDLSLDPHHDFQYNKNTGPDSTDLGAGDSLHIEITRNISSTDLDEVRNGKKFIYVWGLVTYRDAFQRCQYDKFRVRSGEESKTIPNQWGLVAALNSTTGQHANNTPDVDKNGCVPESQNTMFGTYGMKGVFFPN